LRGEVFRAGAVVFRGADFRAVDFLGAPLPLVSDLSGVIDVTAGSPADRLVNWWTTSAVPPTASRSGHSTKPAAPTTPRVNAAAGVEWLPLATPLRIPDAAPWRPPIAPLIAAPPTAPAAEVVASAVRITTRAAPRTMSIVHFLPSRFTSRIPAGNPSGYPGISCLNLWNCCARKSGPPVRLSRVAILN
jgi:hypothetical protein